MKILTFKETESLKIINDRIKQNLPTERFILVREDAIGEINNSDLIKITNSQFPVLIGTSKCTTTITDYPLHPLSLSYDLHPIAFNIDPIIFKNNIFFDEKFSQNLGFADFLNTLCSLGIVPGWKWFPSIKIEVPGVDYKNQDEEIFSSKWSNWNVRWNSASYPILPYEVVAKKLKYFNLNHEVVYKNLDKAEEFLRWTGRGGNFYTYIQYHNIKGWKNLPQSIEGNVSQDDSDQDGGDPLSSTKILNAIANKYKPKNILEIGLNAGHSACILLNSTDCEEYHAFDICRHNTEQKAVNELKKYFNIKLYAGDSVVTVPAFFEDNDTKFDLVFVDGGHFYECAFSDISNTIHNLNKNGLMLIDDFYSSEIVRAYDDVKGQIPNFNQQFQEIDTGALRFKLIQKIK